MATKISVEQAVERAQRVQDHRINAIRSLAHARQAVDIAREDAAALLAKAQREAADQVAAAEREDIKQYSAALAAGWSPDELRKVGFTQPDKTTRVHQRRTRKSATPAPKPAASDISSDQNAGVAAHVDGGTDSALETPPPWASRSSPDHLWTA